MQKKKKGILKQKKESSGKGNGKFRVVTILDEIIERKNNKRKN